MINNKELKIGTKVEMDYTKLSITIRLEYNEVKKWMEN